MVKGKSRDIIALTLSGERIESLTDEINAFADEHGVPERFRPIHQEITGGTGTIVGIFDQAKSALRNLDFSKMPALIDTFNAAADDLHDAQAHLQTAAGDRR